MISLPKGTKVLPFGLSILSRSLRNKTQKEPLTPSSYLLRDSERKTCSSKKKKKKISPALAECGGWEGLRRGLRTRRPLSSPPAVPQVPRESLPARCVFALPQPPAGHLFSPPKSNSCAHLASPLSETTHLHPTLLTVWKFSGLCEFPAFVYQNRDVSPINLQLLTYQPGWKN